MILGVHLDCIDETKMDIFDVRLLLETMYDGCTNTT
jgi:hypothetical protein